MGRAIHALSNEPTFKLKIAQSNNSDLQFDFAKCAKVLSIFRQNSHGDICFYASSKINHSCQPNAHLNTASGQLTGLRTIRCGEELLISYFERDASLYKHAKLRRYELLRSKGFECKCVRCHLLCRDDARNFECQFCSGLVSWNPTSSRLFNACDNEKCKKYPNAKQQAKFIQIEKRMSVFLMETNDQSSKQLQQKLIDDAEQYLSKSHYLLIALYHRLCCQTNRKSIKWLKCRYDSMRCVYGQPNAYLLRAAMDFYRFIPLMAVGDMFAGKVEQLDKEKKEMMDGLRTHIQFMELALGCDNSEEFEN